MRKLIECKRCKTCNLNTNGKYDSGIVSYCKICGGFFNKKNQFIKEGSYYCDPHYKYDWFLRSSLILAIFIFGLLVYAKIFEMPWWLVIIFILISFIAIYHAYSSLEKENFFIG